MSDWAPWARRTLVLTSTPRFTGTARKITMHTMECGGEKQCCWPTYGYGSSTPHHSWCPLGNDWRQHIPHDRSARAMKSPGGGRSPNINAGLNIQIEVCAWAKDVERYGDEWYRRLAEKIEWLCDDLGIPKRFPFRVGYSSTAYRVGWERFRDASGIVFHQNAPFNDHWDAPYDQARLLRFFDESDYDEDELDGEVYTVKKGDSLWSIAERFYGDGNRWKDIAAVNSIPGPKYVITAGQQLVLPGITPDPKPKPPPKPGKAPPFPYPSDHYFGPPPASAYRDRSRVHNGKTDPVAYRHVQTIRKRMRERGWSQVAASGYYTGNPSNPCGGGMSEEVCQFQRAVMKTSGDGFVGPNTWKALWEKPVT